MDDLPPLEVMLECIPASSRHRLEETLEDRRSRVTIAKSIRNWKTLAQFLPNIKSDIEGIELDNRSHELQQIALLDKWQKRNGPGATYRKLAECLYEAEAIETLQVLCSELGGDLHRAPQPGQVMLRDLIKLSTSKRNIRISEESAVKFIDIGVFLLRDDTGAIVNAIANTACGDQVQAVRMIYVKWMEDDEDHSWEKLIQCFRDVQLNSLARDLELHFRLTSPSDRVGRREPDPQLLSQRHLGECNGVQY
jgi:hypothetical protein